MAGRPRQETAMAERENAFLTDLLQAIADRSRRLFGRNGDGVAGGEVSAKSLAEALLSTRGEASGVALARAILDRWNRMGAEERRAWFAMLADEFGPNTDELESAVAAWTKARSPVTASRLHAAAEPRRQELLRRINLAPGGTATLVKMREALLQEIKTDPDLATVDADFAHLFGSWFNRGFLLLRRIDWSSPADILEKIIRYEAVHEIKNWNDLRGRLKPADRRCFAFFHPQMHDDPLVFVEVALTRGIPSEIGGLIAEDRKPIRDAEADTAVFYSISNTQTGLRGISFGNFLIKQVVEELLRELPGLKTFVTLSPVPGFAAWLAKERTRLAAGELGKVNEILFTHMDEDKWHLHEQTRTAIQLSLEQAAAFYLLDEKAENGKPVDPVARFHLNNGARLERINFCGDISLKGLKQAHGIMVNYLYNPGTIENNHELYANAGEVVASASVRKLLAADAPASITRNIQALLSPQRPQQKKEFQK